MSLVSTVTEALGALEPDARDGATRALALLYAEQIDADPVTLEVLGPKLLSTLEALGMSPRARASATKGPPGATRNPLDELRERRAQRVSGTD
jgi:hypothetical protein